MTKDYNGTLPTAPSHRLVQARMRMLTVDTLVRDLQAQMVQEEKEDSARRWLGLVEVVF